jgi:hypothetical protein
VILALEKSEDSGIGGPRIPSNMVLTSLKSILALGVIGIPRTISDPLPSYDPQEIITRDVCIIGGGSSGTYAAIQLHDAGKSIIVLEKEAILGGHTNTYVDPTTNVTVDYGVVVFHDLDIVKTYFNRLGVPFKKASHLSPSPLFVDLSTGRPVSNYTPPNPANALAAYGQQAAQYPELEAGFYLPDPVPEDLLMPFGHFVDKYNLSDAVQIVASFGQGLGDILNLQTLYVFKNFGLDILRNIQVGFLDTASGNNQEIYQKAQEVLGSDLLFRTQVVSIDRSAVNHIKVLVHGPFGIRTIKAKKLLISIPPTRANLHGFNLDQDELDIFGQFVNTGYYTGLVRSTGLQNITAIKNIGPNTPQNLPQLPGLYGITATAIPGLYDVKYGSQVSLPVEVVKADIIAAIKRLQETGIAAVKEEPEFMAFSSHAPFELTVSTENIKSGFYSKLYALQGRQNTFYTGAAFHTQDSSLLWQFTDALLPQLNN